MRKELDYIIAMLHIVLEGEPWYGKSSMKILRDVNPSIVHKKPNGNSHSLIELLYHINTWADFTLKRLEKDEKKARPFLKVLIGGKLIHGNIVGKRVLLYVKKPMIA